MNLKIEYVGTEIIVTDAGSVARPIIAYQKGQWEDAVYVIIKRIPAKNNSEDIEIKLIDMSTRLNMRVGFPIIILRDKKNFRGFMWSLITITTSIGDFNDENWEVFSQPAGPNLSAGGIKIMNSIWTRNIPQLFLTLLEVTVKYCSQEFIHHKPWLMDLDEKEKEILMDMLTKQMGRHPNKIETKK